jgi:hypothetical protein
MNKYAAVTALVIAIITGLALAVSASLTPAHANVGLLFKCCAGIYPGPHYYDCNSNCLTEVWNTIKLWDGARNPPGRCPPLLQACITTCVKAKEATQH